MEFLGAPRVEGIVPAISVRTDHRNLFFGVHAAEKR